MEVGVRKIILLVVLAFILFSCDNGGMKPDEIEESFKADNPFQGVWVPVDGSVIEVTDVRFDSNYNVAVLSNGYGTGHTSHFDYSYNGEKLLLHPFDEPFVQDEDRLVLYEFPYDFSTKRTFVFFGKEIKKISPTLP